MLVLKLREAALRRKSIVSLGYFGGVAHSITDEVGVAGGGNLGRPKAAISAPQFFYPLFALEGWRAGGLEGWKIVAFCLTFPIDHSYSLRCRFPGKQINSKQAFLDSPG